MIGQVIQTWHIAIGAPYTIHFWIGTAALNGSIVRCCGKLYMFMVTTGWANTRISQWSVYVDIENPTLHGITCTCLTSLPCTIIHGPGGGIFGIRKICHFDAFLRMYNFTPNTNLGILFRFPQPGQCPDVAGFSGCALPTYSRKISSVTLYASKRMGSVSFCDWKLLTGARYQFIYWNTMCHPRANLRDLVKIDETDTKHAGRRFWAWLRRQPWRKMLPQPKEYLVYRSGGLAL